MTAPQRQPADQKQRDLALEPSRSFIVQAPAGSGKTELLVRRYLKLLGCVKQPESIVAITFTRKAASEMKRRVLAALQDNLTLAPGILENPSRLRIQTIDSFCFSLARQMPLLSGFGAQPALIDDASELHRSAARATLAQLDSGQPWAASIERLLRHLDNNFARIEELLMDMLGKRDQWLRLIYRGFDRAELEAALQASISHRLAGVRAAFIHGFEAELPGDDDLATWQELAKKYLTADGDFRKNLEKKLNVSRDDADIQRFSAHLHSVRSLPAAKYTDEQWDVLTALVDLLKVANAQLRLVFQQAGQVDFTEVSQAALRALGTAESPTDLAYSLDYRIQHLLVDEFQDTSFSQYALLERLTAGWQAGDERSLFLVGDPMQSIYRFREADVGLFLRTRKSGLGDLQLTPLTLSVNFRSQRNIVEWVNQAFPSILAEAEDADTGAVTYSPSVAHHVALEGAAVQVHPFCERQDEAEAERVLQIVREAKEAGRTAILVRAKSHAVKIAHRLTEAGVRFRAVELESLGERQVILDLLSLTRAMLNPADRTAWLAVLRAPWCGMTLAQLLAVPANAVTAAPEVLREAIENRGRTPLRRWVEETWIALGGPACVQSETDLEDSDAYFELLETHAQGAEIGDPALFQKRLEKLFAKPDVAADDSVQIMTMHKSKGLQFETVILPGLGRKPGSDSTKLLTWLETGGKLLVAPIKETGEKDEAIADYIRSIEKQKSKLEIARLLYVAATRAKSTLHLLGYVNDKGKADGASLLNYLWSAVGDAFAGVQPAPVAMDEVREPVAVRKLAEGWRVPDPPPAVEWGAEHTALVAEEVPPTFDWASDTLRHAGTVVHRMMQRIAREGIDAWSAESVEAERPYFLAALATLGVPPAEISDAADRVAQALTMTLDEKRGRWALSQHQEAESEYALTGFVDGKLFSGTVDRTFVDAGIRWIVDFKTSAHEGGGLDEFLDEQQRRYRRQLDRYAVLIGELDERPIRLGLYFPLLGGWREWSTAFRDEDDGLAERKRAARAEP